MSFLLGSLSTLVSAAVGYWVGFLKKEQEDRRRRKAVASALLFELRPLERMLRIRAEHSRAAESTVTIAMPTYDRFESDLLLFPSATVRVLLELRAYVRDISYTSATYASDKNVPDDDANHYTRLKATAAASLIPAAKRLLENAGGESPPDPDVELYRTGRLPQLPPPAFPNASKPKE